MDKNKNKIKSYKKVSSKYKRRLVSLPSLSPLSLIPSLSLSLFVEAFCYSSTSNVENDVN